MGIFDSSPKMGVLSGGASSYSNASSKGIPVSYSEDQNRVILYKTEHIAVLQKMQEIEFIKLFDEITKEGYSLMSINESKFYFQKILDK